MPLLLAAVATRSGATPPSPPLDFSVRALDPALDPTRAQLGLPFAVEVTPRIAGAKLTIEVVPRDGAALEQGALRRLLDRPAAFGHARFDYVARVARGQVSRVYVRATLEAPDGTRYTRGENLSLSVSPLPMMRSPGRVVPGRAGDALLAFEGTPARASAGSPPARTAHGNGIWIATGQFLYHDREQDLNGFTGIEPDRPARRVDVQVVDATTSAILATGATDASGFFSIPVTDALTRNVRVRLVSLSSATPGLLLDVRNNANARAAYAVNGLTVNGHNPTVDVNFGAVTAAPGAGGEAFNAFDVLLNGCDYFATLEGGSRPNLRLTAYWETGSADGTFFQPQDNSIHLRGGEGYDDTVIGHEQGHFIARNWSKDQTPGGVHYIGDSHQELRLAWSEGFATWWAGAVRRALALGPRPDAYIDTDGSPGTGNLNFSFTFETPNVPSHGAANENAVSACLWDTMDDASTPDGTPGVDDDGLAHPTADAWEVIRNYLPQPAVSNVSLEDFWDGWFRPAQNHGDPALMGAAFGALDVRYASDAGEPDGTFAQARDVVPNGAPAERTFFPSGDVDHFRFTASALHIYVVETTDDLSDANTALTVYAADQVTVLGSNDDRSSLDHTSRVSFVAPSSGTCYVRVTHAADLGVYGSYVLRIADGATGTAGFTDVASDLGVAHTGNFRGVAWGDVDGDGRVDLFLTNLGGPPVLDRNLGGSFVNRASAWGVAAPAASEGAAFCDYDKDGDLDLFVTTLGPTYLFKNRRADSGDSTFVDVSASAGVARTLDGRSAAWGDADRDGFADLFVCDAGGASVLFRNLGNGSFQDVTAAAGLTGLGAAYAASWCDYDRDGDDDLYVAARGGRSRLLRNRLRETGSYGFDDVTQAAGVPAGLAATACDWGDFDGDRWMDLYVADAGGPNFLYRNLGNGTFADQALERGARLDLQSTCAMWADYDNDQDLDLFVGNLSQTGLAGTNQLYESAGGHFSAVPALAVSLPTRAAAWADYDGDLDPDLYLACANNQANQLLRNDAGNHHALSVALIGRASNRDGFGATVRVVAGGRVQYRVVSGGSGFGSQNSIPVEFGLGIATVADSLVVDWPSGRRSILLGLASGPYVVDEAAAVDVARPELPAYTLAFDHVTPNPSRAQGGTTIAYVVPGARAQGPGATPRVTLLLYSIAGRRVRTLVDGFAAPGPARVAFDGLGDAGTRLAPGVYLLELASGASRAGRKLVLLQ
jgi:hypothetical protein